MTFPDVLTCYYDRRFTGQMVLHWAQGHVVSVDIPPSEPLERIRIDTRKRVDSRPVSVKLDKLLYARDGA
jgi:hypothetical protein